MHRVAIVAAIATAAAPAPAAADEVSGAELANLAAAASDDPSELPALAAVTSVDGVPFDLAAVLDRASAAETVARLGELERAANELDVAAAPDADELRATAERLTSSAEELEAPAEEGDGVAHVPAVPLPLGIALALIAGGAGAVLAHRAGRRRVLDVAGQVAGSRPRRSDRPADLERDAARAEREGDWERAIRLRFRAGLLRLHAAGAIGLRPSLTAPAAAREAGSPTLARLAGDYERIVFGRRPADRGDAERHRSEWGGVLAEVGEGEAR